MELRAVGTKNELKGFEKHLDQDKKYNVVNKSKFYQVHGTNKKYRIYFEVEKSNVNKDLIITKEHKAALNKKKSTSEN